MFMRLVTLGAAAIILAACSSTNPQDSSTIRSSGTAGPPPGGPSIGGTAGAGNAAGAIRPGTQQDFVTNVGDRVLFALNETRLTPEAIATLDKQAAWLQRHPQVTFVVEGHCDERGTREFNLALGQSRATAVKDYLAARGVNPARMRTVSFGKERPVAIGSDDQSFAQNRRGVTVVQPPAGS